MMKSGSDKKTIFSLNNFVCLRIYNGNKRYIESNTGESTR
jgi:hypothetical protein